MKTLYIFTKKYPYGKAEAFLESEIIELSKVFKKIVVCPAFEDEFLRKTPDNVEINKSFIYSKKEQIISFFIALINGVFIRTLWDHLNKIKSLRDFKNIIRYATYDVYYLKVCENTNIDFSNSIVYSYWFCHFVNSLQRVKTKLNLDFKVITRAHRWDIYEDEHGIFPYRQKSIDRLEVLYSISKDGKKYLEERYGNTTKIKIARLGVYDRNQLSKSSKENELNVISVSQVTHRKRIFLLLDSLVSYATKNKNVVVRWVHFGTGVEMENLKKVVGHLNLDNLKIDLRGYVLNTEIYTFYKTNAIDVFVNLSESEGVPVSIMEAQSFGVPVIATDVGGTCEIVNSSVGVLLNSAPTINEVCSAIEVVINKEFKRTQIKEYWNEKSNAEKKYQEFTKELIKL
ncbi:glycosyltransferase [Polaribacter sp. HaHaR_3_91]|uniref:glycosyltransferase n=1 Tax=Polaribacter sp. HaHaR_3_91 TaxID=2745561 RepID=UPI001C4EBA43|nr:glycosyltransferase [Polaribacter sp. HaHaR_3_91]QXP64479.1 glycosyltransferase [Polaribacter sp. HaHaR_3_91]